MRPAQNPASTHAEVHADHARGDEEIVRGERRQHIQEGRGRDVVAVLIEERAESRQVSLLARA